jgi:hypothetical protein
MTPLPSSQNQTIRPPQLQLFALSTRVRASKRSFVRLLIRAAFAASFLVSVRHRVVWKLPRRPFRLLRVWKCPGERESIVSVYGKCLDSRMMSLRGMSGPFNAIIWQSLLPRPVIMSSPNRRTCSVSRPRKFLS